MWGFNFGVSEQDFETATRQFTGVSHWFGKLIRCYFSIASITRMKDPQMAPPNEAATAIASSLMSAMT